MAKALTPATRIEKARQLIFAAKSLEAPESVGWEYFSYVAQVKEELRKAFELLKLIPYSPNTPDPIKAEAKAVMEEIETVRTEILKS